MGGGEQAVTLIIEHLKKCDEFGCGISTFMDLVSLVQHIKLTGCHLPAEIQDTITNYLAAPDNPLFTQPPEDTLTGTLKQQKKRYSIYQSLLLSLILYLV